ncbi:phosphopentomutase [Roseinatronobacter alkalisoli]|uniref:Phosphopentomutase n=1 Tax=Roseinatronobacter alkalisoli TaxID=3028235 RepID=A0ABT5T3X6_9RHOB|nr:phosphopentomutase [Roseinatronobacter sp. HJB301]MDD7969744.1 phosphopentomutase [Roseinatronobacter sp. HJB301]
MARAFLVVLDSVGCGGAPDAAEFGDDGANTLGHVIAACADGRAEDGRSGPLHVPVLDSLGLGAAVRLASGAATPGLSAQPGGLWGAATETSRGKDTPSGHWELAGVPVPWDWTYFPRQVPAFAPELVAQICTLAGTDGILGNCHAAGIPIVQELGAEHLRTGWPICYTSVDSVVQIAAHEGAFGLDRLHRLCADLAPTLHAMRVGRVIARPFTGTAATGFVRTPDRRDFAMAPPAPTLCDWVQTAGRQVHAVGKIGDIFSGQGITRKYKGADDHALFEHFLRLIDESEAGSLTFCNFVEFDTLYGHTRDVSGYARALQRFDKVAGQALERLRSGDMLVITADHGNDPTAPGTDHTRERVPVLVAGYGAGQIGHCAFADVAASIAAHLGVPAQGPGRSFLP